MGLLSRILGRGRSQPKPYVDAGVALIYKLTNSLSLPGWKDGLPSYTPVELDAINRRMSSFQKTANDVAGGEVKFHPEVVPDLQRMLCAKALIELAGNEWKFSDEVPRNWKECVATYLKAWASIHRLYWNLVISL